MSYKLPTPVQWAINRLASCGYEAYAVGGCVRDMLLDRRPHDWDVCTSASPREVVDCFANVRVLTTGIKHGTVTALLDGQNVEITTYRVDGEYGDHRHPDQVRFTTSLREDLARRDFTINAMAYQDETGIIDYYNGQADLAAGLIRSVGNPDERFAEDALRILRALRFASRFQFRIEPDTSAALLRRRQDLAYVAVERILYELSGMDFAHIDPMYLPVLQVIIPELRAIDVPPGLPPEPALRLSALLQGLNAEAILKRLKASAALTRRVSLLASLLDTPVAVDRVSMRRLLRKAGPEAAGQLLLLQGNEEGLGLLADVIQQGDAYSLAQLDIKGDDLVRLGFSGKQVGHTLEAMLTMVIDGELPNDHDKLIKAAGIGATLRQLPLV